MFKKLIQIGLLLNLMLLLIFCGTTGEKAILDLSEIDIVSEEVEDERWELSGEDKLVFSFENQYRELDNLLLKFTGMQGHAKGTLKVRLTRLGVEYFYYELPLALYNEELFYLYTGEIEELIWNYDYKLEISVSDLGTDSIYLSGCKENLIGWEKSGEFYPIMGVSGVRQLGDRDVIGGYFTYMVLLNALLGALWVVIRISGRAVYWHAGCFLVGGILILGMPTFFGSDELIQSREIEYWVSDIIPEITHIPLRDGAVEQTFTAQHDLMENVYLFFDHQSAEDDAIVCVLLEDKKGNVIAQWECDTAKLGEDTFCLLFYPEQKLSQDKEYTIKVFLEGTDSDITVRSFTKEGFHKSVGALYVAGAKQENTALYFVQRYQVQYSFVVIGVWVFVIAFLCYLASVLRPDMCKVLRRILTILIPIIGFVGIELLSGNLGLTRSTDIWKNILLFATILLLLRGLVGRFADYFVIVLAFLAGTVNYYVLHTRGTDFLLSDIRSFSTAMTVAGNYELAITPPVYLAGAVAISLILMCVYLDRKCSEKTSIRERVITAVLGGVAALWLFVFVLPGESILLYDISGSLRDKGWSYGNACLLQVGSVSKPDGYSEQGIQSILEEHDADMERETEIVPENLIVIMNEALSDLQLLGDLETSEDSLAFIRSLTENTVKGNLHVPTLGGNTCNTEYEFLTGNSLHFITSAVVPYMVLCEEEEPGISSILRSQGYHTVAMHPYIGENWNRDSVYEAMGFDVYLDVDDFPDAELIRNFVSDKGDYDRIIEYYENMDSDEKLFVFNVTMQNHGGYDVNNGYIEKSVTIDNVESELAENYLSLVKESDEAFEYLLDYFSKVDEATMIVMFGDHQPSFPADFYEQLNAVSVSGKNTEGDNERFLYVTPYIIWTNYESDFAEISDMSSNYLSSYVMQCAGLELSEYQEFLLQFMEKYPVIGKYGVSDANGAYTIYNEETKGWLKDYEYLQYLRIKDRKSEYYSVFSEGYE